MKSYLSLIPISARVHRRRNGMTRLCIIFAVFLVTAVFGMADMGIRMEKARLLNKHGSLTLQDLSGSAAVQTFYSAAAVLFVLILLAGVLMISSSINSNVAQRTEFFGLMRCIGMSRRQIILFVRLEALNWCKTAVPTGVISGMITTWLLCAVLRFLVGGEFSDIPLLGISPTGIVCGVMVGFITVLIAAGSPAKRAAGVSPAAAVTGNYENTVNRKRIAGIRFLKAETALGIHHAVSARKTLILMTGSFALSIILFLSFYVFTEFIGCLIPQLSSTSDLEISSADGSDPVSEMLLKKISGMNGVKCVFGRRSSFGMPAEINQELITIDMISYDEYDLDCLIKDNQLKKGSDISKVYGNSNYALVIWDEKNPIKMGDQIRAGNETLEIAGQLRYNPFSSDGSTDGTITLITSGQTFARITGIAGYSLVLIQTTANTTDEDVSAIRRIAVGDNRIFRDRRDQRTTGTYTAFLIFVYGFLSIITMVTVLNIMNSISMSVSAKMKQYGAMRAVGMDECQLIAMIAAEACTYAISGCVIGCTIGLLISKWLYDTLITAHFSYAVWSVPIMPLFTILLFVLTATAAAVWAPVKRIRKMSITDTLNEL